MKERIRGILMDTGASAVGFARAGEIDAAVHSAYAGWIRKGFHGEMDYLERHVPLRHHTDNVLPGAETVISLAFSYVPDRWLKEEEGSVAAYAYGDDYHIVLRDILKPVVSDLKKEFGGKWRICIDSAPVAERYWAMKAGLGKRGLNGSIIVRGCGSLCFLVEILTTIPIEPDKASDETCEKCGLCISACPGKAINSDGTIDARKCINYITIEKEGQFSIEESQLINKDKKHLYGCDNCLRICPHNEGCNNTSISRFLLKENIESLTPEKFLNMEDSEFQALFKTSPLLYAGYKRLKRNAEAIITKATGNS